VQGIPVLVLVDAMSGKMITSSGRKCVVNDPEGKEFPWIPEPLNSILFSGHLLKGTGEIDSKLALTGMVKGLYFSAHWVCIVYNIKMFFC
jgi:nucleoredoxin